MGPINVAYLTSFREIVGDELVGQELDLSPEFPSLRRRIGNLEDLLHKTSRSGNPELAQQFNVVGVIADDWGEALDALFATGAHTWPWPVDAQADLYKYGHFFQEPMDERTCFISSRPWRMIRDPVEKSALKGLYERAIIEQLDRLSADLIVSDSYVSIMGPYRLPYFSPNLVEVFPQRALNIHPAVVVPDHPNRLPGLYPTRDAILRMQRTGYDRTGVTVHLIDGDIDHGPTVDFEERTVVLPIDMAHTLTFAGIERRGHLLRERNYEWKRGVLSRAMQRHVVDSTVQDAIQRGRIQRETRMQRYHHEHFMDEYAAHSPIRTGADVIAQYGLSPAVRGVMG